MTILKDILIGLEVLLLFNLLIFVHELGHFLAARWRGLKIDRFAIWFGKPIWKAKINGVEYALGSIPAGGYVALPANGDDGGHRGQEAKAPPSPCRKISALDKIIVAFAGPLFSFLLALAFAVVVMFVGRPVSEAETTTTIGYVEKDGPADKVGLQAGRQDPGSGRQAGDQVRRHGRQHDLADRPQRRPDRAGESRPRRQGPDVFNPAPTKDETKFWQRKSLRQIQDWTRVRMPSIVSRVTNSPAASGGARSTGDQILAVNGNHLYSFGTLDRLRRRSSGASDGAELQRDGKSLEVKVVPEFRLARPTARQASASSIGRTTMDAQPSGRHRTGQRQRERDV